MTDEFIESFNALSVAQQHAYKHAKLAVISACIGHDSDGCLDAMKKGCAADYFKKKVSVLNKESLILPEDMVEVVKLEIMNVTEEVARQYWAL